jgi:prepilin-type N-terminal cleavage/methylation domain-containing protein
MRGKHGIALIEVLVAMVILGFAASGLATAFSTATLLESGMQQREAQFAAMDRVMTAMSLLTAADLRHRLGIHRVGEFVVSVQAPEPELYRVRVAPDSGTSSHGLETLLFRRAGAEP